MHGEQAPSRTHVPTNGPFCICWCHPPGIKAQGGLLQRVLVFSPPPYLPFNLLPFEKPSAFQGEGIAGWWLIILYGRGPQLPVRSWVVQQEVSSGWVRANTASSVFTATPRHLHYAWAPPPIRSAAVSDFHRIVNPTVGCTREGSRLGTPYENHRETIPLIPSLWRNCLSWNWTLVPKTLGGSPLRNFTSFTQILLEVPPGPGLFSSVRKCAHTISSQTNSD